MLPSRFNADPIKNPARLSHAVRILQEQKPEDWPEITSINIDELIKRPLPSAEQQLANFLRWAAKQLDDDQLGWVDLPNPEWLAGIIGALDQDRVEDLISIAKKDGLIELLGDSSVQITRRGWTFLEPPAQQTHSKMVEQKKLTQPEISKAHCNNCGGDRKCFVRASYTVTGTDRETSWSDTYDTLECCGCSQMIIRHDHWFSEWDTIEGDTWNEAHIVPGIKTTYWPPPSKRKKPEWSSGITDEVLQQLFDELYSALSSDLIVLATIGARTLFDRASFLLVGDPAGGFPGKLEALQKDGHISQTEKDILQAMTDAGSASAHRGHVPSPAQLKAIVDILENFVERKFVLGEVAVELRQSTPPRTSNKHKK